MNCGKRLVLNVHCTAELVHQNKSSCPQCESVEFLLEVSHQVRQIMLTGASGPADENDFDGSSLMQSALVSQQKARILFATVQSSLDRLPDHKGQRARLLRHKLNQHFRDVPHHRTPEEIAEFNAVLLVYENEYDTPLDQCLQSADEEWVQMWWKRVVEVVNSLQQAMGTMGAATSSTAPTAPPCPDERDEELEVLGNTQRDSEDDHNLKLYEEDREEEEKYMMELAAECEREQEANAFREKELREFQEEMERPPPKTRRLQIDVLVEAAGERAKSKLNAPLVQLGESAKISLTFRQMPDDTTGENEDTSLMQKRPRPMTDSAATGSEGIRRLRELLAEINPGIRGKVIQRLRGLILRELKNTLYQGIQLIEILNTEALGDSTPCDDEANVTVTSMAQFLLQHLRLPDLLEEIDVADEDFVTLLSGLQEHLRTGCSTPSASASATTGAALLCQRPILGTGDEIIEMVAKLRRVLDNKLLEVPPEDMLEARRCMVLDLVDYVQTNAACTLLALHLLSNYLPQPNQVVQSGSTQRFRQQAVMSVDATMRAAFTSQASSSMAQHPFGQDEVIPLLPALRSLLLEAIMFMDTGDWEGSDAEEAESESGNDEGADGSNMGDGEGGTGGAAQADAPPCLHQDGEGCDLEGAGLPGDLVFHSAGDPSGGQSTMAEDSVESILSDPRERDEYGPASSMGLTGIRVDLDDASVDDTTPARTHGLDELREEGRRHDKGSTKGSKGKTKSKVDGKDKGSAGKTRDLQSKGNRRRKPQGVQGQSGLHRWIRPI